ncbi:glycosyltransferase involved in cell wall biosynthesis [Tenacibaculum gallaicum]|uniref:Glycosyltransferase involved in cell wall biosynthesis n=1 Tax=Tenacibaculum gallaicum TaxID=561505 RepID=A0A3E0HH65_9FLAO|nr:glycosyltransferase family 4 protein [Tenacibaculum gallaicum]REH45777.1 glycosyltransferase involved in cell wall biosynthesis [Tenacibaculum gallaicum]
MLLHITNDFSGSKVYKSLIQQLDQLELSQIIYTAVRREDLIGKNHINFKQTNSSIIYRNILKKTDKLRYFHKINKVTDDVEAYVDLSKVTLIHAHTWYSDGGVAYQLYKKHNIPYIITIRNTDLNLFYKYGYHLRKRAKNIIEYASKVFFISPSYHKRFFNLKPFVNKQRFIKKSEIIPNGIDSFWIRNYKVPKQNPQKLPVVLYIGKFAKGKNVLKLINAITILNAIGVPCQLNLVGGGGSEEKKILEKVKRREAINFKGKITDKKLLQQQFTKADIFAMPSKGETFGLVYIEAISQGLPIIYTQKEGIDGYYENIGVAVEPNNEESIINAVKQILENYNPLQNLEAEITANHDWSNIAKKHKEIYANIAKNNKK